MWTRRAVLPALISAALLRQAAGAEAYPARPIRVVVPFSAGGGTDIVARTIMAHVAESLGGVIVIDNRGGVPAFTRTCLTIRCAASRRSRCSAPALACW